MAGLGEAYRRGLLDVPVPAALLAVVVLAVVGVVVRLDGDPMGTRRNWGRIPVRIRDADLPGPRS